MAYAVLRRICGIYVYAYNDSVLFKGAGKQNGQYYDLQLMAILKEEWEALHPEKAGKTIENVSPQPIDY